jgi:hypothetical protein
VTFSKEPGQQWKKSLKDFSMMAKNTEALQKANKNISWDSRRHNNIKL